ncbi:SWIM zinc finger family protein [Streptomyces sp. NPDC005251]|uniref:SWIM zinc finger family protein n=1 Tax=Streptomyces sp. NPDC005251 TaxID=3157166 RepID=UPI00339E1D1B
MTGDRPADEARRALRAAREAAAADEHSGAGSGPGAGAIAGAEREAATGTPSVSTTPSPSSPSAPSAPSARVPEAPPRASAAGSRPSDAAREALRRATAAAKIAGAGAGAGAGVGDGEGVGANAGPSAGLSVQPTANVHPDEGSDIDAGARVRGVSGERGVPDARDVAVPASDGAAEAGSGQRPAGASAERPEAREPATTGRSGEETTGGARPGDIAREALRAAREEARRLRSEGANDGGERTTEADGKGVGPRRRSARPSAAGSRGRRSPVHPVATDRESRERELRDLLAGAFQLPPDVAAITGHPTHPADDTAEATHDRDHGRPADPVHPVPEWETSASPEPFTPGPLDPVPFTPKSFTSRSFTPGSPGAGAAPYPPTGALDPADTPGEPVTPLPAERLPRSMASPGRDGELRRTFPAFPARVRGAGGFAETWWGNAWVTALEEGALDAARLARGRTYAGQGYVDAITVTPGLVLAYVHGSRPRPYRVQVRVRTLSDDDWDRFLDAAAERPGHIAALLDKEMPKSLADCGVALLPGPGELEPHCSCPDFGHPCKHAAALCYQMARLLDQDPFVLFLLRGRGERELLDALSRRSAARAARAAQEREPAPLPGVRARDALARRVLPPLPAPLPPPAHPEQPPTYPAAPGGPDPFALDQLATDAAARAHALLTSGRDPVAELTLWQDAVRIAAARPGSGLTAGTRALYSSLASATGRTPAELARAVAAWRQGGFDALGVLEEPWDPPAGRFDRARPLLMAADFPAFRPWRNHLTHPRGHAQLRLGRNGLWYAYESEPGHDDWWPRGTPDLDPVGALTGLGAPGAF